MDAACFLRDISEVRIYDNIQAYGFANTLPHAFAPPQCRDPPPNTCHRLQRSHTATTHLILTTFKQM